ncbi:MAG: hypothetical protein JST86_01905 [Bacteroidetes bacterium]|nr:hypothetical protein [Bacteroidota bacterium]
MESFKIVSSIFILSLTVLMACKEKYNWPKQEENVRINKDTCRLKETFLGYYSENKAPDTIYYIDFNLQSDTMKAYVHENVDIGIDFYKTPQNGNFGLNVIYQFGNKNNQNIKFYNYSKGGRIGISNIENFGLEKRLGANLQVIQNNGEFLLINIDWINKNRLDDLAKYITEITKYNSVYYESSFVDTKSVYVVTGSVIK